MSYYQCPERPVPYVTSWAIQCPICEAELPYEPEEADSGAFEMDPASWPVCEECNAMLEPEQVQVIIVPSERTPDIEDDE